MSAPSCRPAYLASELCWAARLWSPLLTTIASYSGNDLVEKAKDLVVLLGGSQVHDDFSEGESPDQKFCPGLGDEVEYTHDELILVDFSGVVVDNIERGVHALAEQVYSQAPHWLGAAFDKDRIDE